MEQSLGDSSNSRHRRNTYANDDYEWINERYFNEIIKARNWNALPAGWLNPETAAAKGLSLTGISTDEAIHYAIDEGATLGEEKRSILSILSAWESRVVHWDEATLCPSVSTANLAVLFALKNRGFKSIVFESPSYFATREQAELLGFRECRVSGLLENMFEISVENYLSNLPEGPSAFWLTQPRFGIGVNQSVEKVRALARNIRHGDVLVFDEAAEQSFPSVLSVLGDVPCDVIRTRGIVKGIGINGLRAAVVLHPSDWRSDFEELLDPVGAALDRFSLRNLSEIAKQKELFPALLRRANLQVNNLRQLAQTLSLGTWIQVAPLTNGYIGSLFLDFKLLPRTYEEKRAALLEYCQKKRMPVVLRASIGFPYDETWEAVRISYFTSEENVRQTIKILSEGLGHLKV